MVGFGSSLRLARRPGWEEAYLDYEALKLLLTQIEAVYEEEAHLQQRRREGLDLDVMFLNNAAAAAGLRHHYYHYSPTAAAGGGEATTIDRNNSNTAAAAAETAPVVRDYRDELFLESDSDAAFESLMKYDYYSAEEAASDLEQQQQQQLELEQVLQLQQPSPSNNNNTMVFGNNNTSSNASHVQSIFSERDSHHHLPQQRRSDMTTSSTFSLGSNFSHTAQDHHPTTSTAAATIATATSTTATGRNLFQQHKNGYGAVSDGYEVHYGRDDDDDDDDDDSQYGQTNCVPASWGVGRSKTKPLKSNNVTKPKKNNNATSLPFRGASGRGASQFLSPTIGESEFFVTTVGTGSSNDAFILDANADDALNDDDNADEVYSYNYNSTQVQQPPSQLTSFSQTQQQHYDYNSSNNNNSDSILQKPFRRTTVSNETTSLLSVPTTPGGGPSSLYSFSTGPVTPPQTDHFTFSGRGSRSLQMPAIAGNPSTVATATTNSGKNNSNSHGTKAQLLKQLEEERKRERRKRRQQRRQRAEKRKALEKKVPPHIRIAHTKARDITERFLGLLRAECEKVMLFAQSRLGELADTVGSLRFPAMEDQQQYNTAAAAGSSHNHHHEAPLSPNSGSVRTPGSYDYPLSDGGMHSASSSSDDGALDSAGLFYWSDSSSDSARSHDSGSPNVPRSLSAFRDMQQAGRQHHKSTSFLQKSDNNKHHGHHQRGRSSKNVEMTNKKYKGFDSAKRHLDHFEKLRRNRPIFQRSGHIMGEDLLLLSAVDESDGYTAVGVELMHVLKFILVNLIAVRKICRKHDRLLMNRMLGGYYQHLKMLTAVESNSRWAGGRNLADVSLKGNSTDPHQGFQDEHVQNAQTLGGLLARESGDIFETHHPAVIGQVNNYRLVGLYDANLQQLANSRTVQVISSCLVLALSEYEVSRSRAKALSGIPAPRRGSGPRNVLWRKQQQDQAYTMTGKAATMGPLDEQDEDNEMDSDDDCGAISTASSISLTRLRFTVTSIIALREAARRKKDMYTTYLSRSMLAFTGQTVVGEGLDGCSRDTLDFLVSYNPDSALLLDPASLNDGLKQGNWSKLSISSVMASCLAWSTSKTAELPHELSVKAIRKQEKVVMNAVNIYPKANFIEVPELFKGPPRAKKSSTAVAILENDCFRSILRINRASHLLYTMNYFVVHPTTITFVRGIGSPGSFSALVIGAPNCAALVAALVHCYVLSGDSRAPLSNLKSLRWLFLFAALVGMVGNAVHVYGIWTQSMFMATIGRFIIGFSCSEILHRNIVASFLPMHRVVTETAILVQMQVLGLFLGLSAGTLAEFLPYHLTGWGIRSLSSSSWLLSSFWFIHFLFVCACFKVDDGDAAERIEANNTAEVEQILTRYNPSHSHSALNQDSDSSASGNGRGNDSSIRRTSLQLTYGAKDEHAPEADQNAVDTRKNKHKKKRGSRKRRMQTIKTFPSRLRRLVTYSVGIPLCLFINLYIKFALEVLFSSCPMILMRYFRWGSGRAGIFLAFLTLTVLPMNFLCSHVARKYEERTVIKKSLFVLTIGLLIMLNYSSVVKLTWQIPYLWYETEEEQWESKYDWLLGIVQYFVGFTLTFFSLTALNSSTLSLLSKVSPPRIRSSSVSLQLGTICTFVSLFAGVLADMQILLIGLSHRIINNDLVNSLVLPLVVVSIVIAHFVRKHYFFLM